jgi:pimeloyl-ACP methyl ester carboxylesterase
LEFRFMQPAGLHIARHHEDAPGPPVVLVHGAPDRSKSFAGLVDQLGDLPVTVYDRRGYGRSLEAAAAGEGLGFDVHADDLIAILDDTPSIVVAHSAGSAVALLAATRAPQLFLALGVWEPPMTAWDWWPPENRDLARAYGRSVDPEATAESFSRIVLGNARWEQLPERTRHRLRAEGAAFVADMASQDSRFFDPDDLGTRARVPGLVGCGDEYPFFVDVNARTADAIGFELLVVEGADHFAPITRSDIGARFVRATIELAGRTDRAERREPRA